MGSSAYLCARTMWLGLLLAVTLAAPGARPVAGASVLNPIVVENQQPGTTAWRPNQPHFLMADDVGKQIKGYAGATSVDKGGTIDFHIGVAPAQTYTIDIYRMGYYGGTGGRLMRHVGPLDGTAQPKCPPNPDTGLIECRWSTSYALRVPSDWTSGIYLAQLTNSRNYQNYIIFTVRDDARTADFLFQQSVMTYQAYNGYPDDKLTGKSLYLGNSYGPPIRITGRRQAVKVSFDRPYSNSGLGIFTLAEMYFVQWIERQGYDVSYCTDLDTHADGARLRNYKALIMAGHGEYWSRPMRDAAEAARNAGVSLDFFGGNDIYWQVRMEPSSQGVANRVMVGYKESHGLDPVQGPTTTSRWRDAPVNRPEQPLLGVQWVPGFLRVRDSYVAVNTWNPLYRDTGFHDGDATVKGIVGYEADTYDPAYPLPAHRSWLPLGRSPITTRDGTQHIATASIYQAPSGAWVFASGSIQWSWGLAKPSYVDPRLQALTAHILDQDLAPHTDTRWGTAAIDDDHVYTTTPRVAVSVPSRIPVSRVRLSNDAHHWITYPYSPSIKWDLSNPVAGGTATGGLHTVYVQWRRGPSDWSPIETDSIWLGAPPFRIGPLSRGED